MQAHSTVSFRCTSLARSCMNVALVAALSSSVACVSTNSYHSARTLEAGKIETQIHPTMGQMIIQADGVVLAAVLPTLDAGIRYGINGKADFGVSIGSKGLNFDSKFQLAKSPSMAIALAPSLGGFAVGGVNGAAGLVNFGMPLLVGLMMGPRSEFVFSPKISVTSLLGSSGGNSGAVGTFTPSIGFGINLELGPGFHLMPELSFGYATAFGSSSSTGGDSAGLGPVFNAGLGIGFGGSYAK